MRFKHNASRRHHILKARRRVPSEAGLRWRGDLTLWLDEAALAGWHAPRRTRPAMPGGDVFLKVDGCVWELSTAAEKASTWGTQLFEKSCTKNFLNYQRWLAMRELPSDRVCEY